MNLSQNFSLAEMTKSETALRLDLPNDPEPDHLENMKALAENVLQPVRNYFGMGVKVNSAYRHPDVNKAVGGSTTSDHCKGMAADIEIPGIANAELARTGESGAASLRQRRASARHDRSEIASLFDLFGRSGGSHLHHRDDLS